MKRILIAGFQKETGSFNPKPSFYEDFDVLSGQAIAYKRCLGRSSHWTKVWNLASEPDLCPVINDSAIAFGDSNNVQQQKFH